MIRKLFAVALAAGVGGAALAAGGRDGFARGCNLPTSVQFLVTSLQLSAWRSVCLPRANRAAAFPLPGAAGGDPKRDCKKWP